MFVYLFPIWAVVVSAVALQNPHWFVDLKSWIVPLLMAVMLGMGLTLRWQDFVEVWHHRFIVGLGVVIQFTIMPFAAWALSVVLGLSTEWMIGMILVGATAGGTASNIMAYLAKGNVALSVSMTLLSTLSAVVLLPVMTWLYLDKSVDVPALSMLLMLLKMIVMPLFLGVLLNHFWHHKVKKVVGWFPIFSMLAILFIIAIVVALNANNLTTVAWTLFLAVALHNLIGLFSGYFIAKKLGYDSVIARTVAIEVGMQNSGLSVALALKFFGPASALPGAIFSLWHNLSGSAFASFWQKIDRQTSSKKQND